MITLRCCLQSPGRQDVYSNATRRNRVYTQRRDVAGYLSRSRKKEETLIADSNWLEKIGRVSSAWVAAGLLLTVPAMAVSTENLLFLEAWRGVNRAYVDKTFNHQNWLKLREQYLKKESMDNRKETYAAIEKMLSTLDDPFTRFLEPSRYDALKGGTRGVVTGVGLEVAYTASGVSKEPEVMVVAPAPGSPAFRADVMPGDVLLEIDGVPIAGDSLYVVGEKLQGEKGSEVAVNSGWNPSRDDGIGIVETEKEKRADRDCINDKRVVFNPVAYKYCTGIPDSGDDSDSKRTVGYIQILRFTDQTAYDVEEAIHKLKERGIDRLLLDLRNNGGGSFPAGVAVSQMLLDKGDIVLIADTEGIRDIVSAEGSTVDPITPLTVLINRGTASASEVLSGALQDNQRAVIVGEASFGKGLIQTLVPLSDGSAITITTAQYQTPSEKDINGIGIQPDIPLPSSIEIPFGDDGNFCSILKTTISSTDFLKKR